MQHPSANQPSPPLFTGCCVANKWAPARWRILGSTPRHAQPFVDKKDRKSMKLSVFVKVGQPTVVVDLRYSGDNTADSPLVVGSGSGDFGWNSQRYVEIVAYHLLGERPSMRPRRIPGGVKLVHDRDPVHIGSVFTTYATSKGITVLTLPAKSPDLDPLDYGVFGTAKRQWERQVWQQRLSWDQQCVLAIQLLSEFDASASIAALPHRMQQCIAAHGWHFEG